MATTEELGRETDPQVGLSITQSTIAAIFVSSLAAAIASSIGLLGLELALISILGTVSYMVARFELAK